MPRTCSVSTDADAMQIAHASAVKRASSIVPLDDAQLHANAIATERIRALGRRGCVVERTAVAWMTKVLEHDGAKRRHARFPLRTATISARIDSATSAELFPPMSSPIGV